MLFNEKIIYLLRLTSTSNKMLATAINVDPSMISLIRTGRRGKPRNEEYLRAMASYFAQHCTTPIQRESLAQEIGHYNVKYVTDYQELCDIIMNWFCQEDDQPHNSAGDIIAEITHADPELKNPVRSELSGLQAVRSIYYGKNGFYLALQDFFNHLLGLEAPVQMYISMDGDFNWYQDNKPLAHDVRYWEKKLLDRGMRICQILPPTSAEPYYDTITHWIPLYLTGQVEVFYYPRIRDHIFRRIMLIVPGEVALVSHMMAGDTEPAFSFLSITPELVNVNETLFLKFLHMCRKILNLHQTIDEISDCFRRYITFTGDSIQLTSSLPQTTLPEEVLRDFSASNQEMNGPTAQEEMQLYKNYLDNKSHDRYMHIDLAPLALPDDVRAGKAIQLVAGSSRDRFYTYTPASYARHLKNIIHRLRNDPNYYFIPLLRTGSPVKENILVTKDHCAMLIRMEPPVSTFEITEPDLVLPFYEYLMRSAEKGHLTAAGKKNVIHSLENLIEELE